jgi:hypothetical protein
MHKLHIYIYDTIMMLWACYKISVQMLCDIFGLHSNVMRHISACIRTWEKKTYIIQLKPLKNT